MKRALIVGAGGDIARALAGALDDDYEITSISRQPGEGERWHQTDYSEESVESLARKIERGFDLMFICNGFLHDDEHRPEKSLRDISRDQLLTSFDRNVVVPALILKHFGKHLMRRQRTVLAILSGRVGSIDDNRAGGWYGYRASKAALNMITKNASIELGRTNRELIVIALHPGTTHTHLSAPFVAEGRGPEAVTPEETATRLLDVLRGLDSRDTGGFFDWRGNRLPW